MAVVNDSILLNLAAELGIVLKQQGWTLTLAESCTGGLAAQYITAIPGSSAWFDCGFVTYSNTAKLEILNVSQTTLDTYGAVSEETAHEMALGALKRSHAHLAAAITGIAGPEGGTADKPVGTVCFAWMDKTRKLVGETKLFAGDREAVRRQSAYHALKCLLPLIKN
jgi:nicotinamide-nucleotide amidase